MTESTRQGLADFLTSFERLALQHGSHEKLQKAIARRLTRVCGLAGIRKRAPTSFRHSGMALAKATQDVATVAYMSGHSSLVTAGRNYAKGKSSIPGMTLIAKAPNDPVAKI
jgi:integrase